MATQQLELKGEHIEVVQSTATGKRSVISDAELDMLLIRRKEVFEGRGVGRKSGAAGKDGKGDNARAGIARAGRGDVDNCLFEVYEATADEGNDALAHTVCSERTSLHESLSFLCEDCILLSYFCALLFSFPCS
ncbi:hypothetical protein BJV74DRAFT_828699, partial [Russula compacta]